jgi:glutathione S-transferase
MTTDSQIIFYHSPNSRSAGVLALLKELGAPYELRLIDMKAKQQRQPEFLAVNPMGKVPAIVHDGALVTEQVAIFIYLADLFPEAGLAPAITDRLRGPYLRWLAYYGSSFEPAIIDVAMKRDPTPLQMCPYGDFDTMLGTLVAQLSTGPYMLGDRFTAADILWGTSLAWTTSFKLVPELPVITAYIARINARPSVAAAKAEDAANAAAQKA